MPSLRCARGACSGARESPPREPEPTRRPVLNRRGHRETAVPEKSKGEVLAAGVRGRWISAPALEWHGRRETGAWRARIAEVERRDPPSQVLTRAGEPRRGQLALPARGEKRVVSRGLTLGAPDDSPRCPRRPFI